MAGFDRGCVKTSCRNGNEQYRVVARRCREPSESTPSHRGPIVARRSSTIAFSHSLDPRRSLDRRVHLLNGDNSHDAPGQGTYGELQVRLKGGHSADSEYRNSRNARKLGRLASGAMGAGVTAGSLWKRGPRPEDLAASAERLQSVAW
jgi:hypothetical protein